MTSAFYFGADSNGNEIRGNWYDGIVFNSRKV